MPDNPNGGKATYVARLAECLSNFSVIRLLDGPLSKLLFRERPAGFCLWTFCRIGNFRR